MNVADGVEECYEILYNSTRIITHSGELVFSPSGIYFFYTNEAEKRIKNPWSVTYDEIAKYEKTGLFGYLITLKDGKQLRFSNVFRKLRGHLNEALQKRVR